METVDGLRRRLIGAALVSLPLLFALGKFLSPRMPKGKTLASAPREKIPPGGALVFRESRVALIREGEEVYALDLSCTHLGCTVRVTSEGLSCPCHGSVFDRRGNVVKGPASRPLAQHRVEESDGTVVVWG